MTAEFSSKVSSPDGTSIAFTRVGAGAALVLVDAAGGYRGFGPMGELATLLDSRFTVFTYDRRGRGESTDTLPYAVDREVDDLQAIIDVAGGSAFVYGFSSGAVLGLAAAARGLAIPKLALLEPPLAVDGTPAVQPGLAAEISRLVAAGRRGDAVEHFNRSIGVPADMISGMRQQPFWPGLEAIAHTLVYDVTITGSLSGATLRTITTPTVVLASDASDDRLRGWARGVSEALPKGSLRILTGEWHGVAADAIAPVLAEFFLSLPR
jgi:pimeloyl-ACP methyl ester carboxylesterase